MIYNDESVIINDQYNRLIKLKKTYDEEDSLGAKGFVHGLQKDLIQNCVGARVNERFNAPWNVIIELKKINNKYSLIITDEGTTGLRGGIYDSDKILKKFENKEWSNEKIPSNENFSRFINDDFSGGGHGPGSQGQGKGLFHMLSSKENDHTVIFESVRSGKDDSENEYIAGKKYVKNVQLICDFPYPSDPNNPSSLKQKYIDNFRKYTYNEIEPLEKVGTRIIIYGIDENAKYELNNNLTFIEIFRNSFKKEIVDPTCKKSFYNMIQETWWEIIQKKGEKATIRLVEGDKERKLVIDGLIKKILELTNKSDKNVIVHEKINISFPSSNNPSIKLRIKKLKFIFFKKEIKDLEHGVFVNRAFMKIGNCLAQRSLDHRLNDKFYGYVELDEQLEHEIEQCENTVHYGFRSNDSFMKHCFNKQIKKEYDNFKIKCGFVEKTHKNQSASLRDSYLDIVKKLNFASVSNWSPSNTKADYEIKFVKFSTSSGSLSVLHSDTIGPISLEIINHESEKIDLAKLKLEFITDYGESFLIHENSFDLPANSSVTQNINQFPINNRLPNKKKVTLKASLISSNQQKASKTRFLWVGMDEPDKNKKVHVKLEKCLATFPRNNSRRVNIGEFIKDIKCSFTSNVSTELECKLIINLIDKIKNKKIDNIFEQSINISFQEDCNIIIPKPLEIDERFEEINLREETESNREVKMEFDIISEKDYPELEIQKGNSLCSKKTIKFYIEFDPIGKGPFSQFGSIDDPNNYKSKHEPCLNEKGYKFILNIKHRCWLDIEELKINDKTINSLKKDYNHYEIAKQALFLAIENQTTDHNFFKSNTNKHDRTYHEFFEDDDLSVLQAHELVEELIEKILN